MHGGDGENEARCSGRPPKSHLKEPARSSQALGKSEVDTYQGRCCSAGHLLERAARLCFPADKGRRKKHVSPGLIPLDKKKLLFQVLRVREMPPNEAQ